RKPQSTFIHSVQKSAPCLDASPMGKSEARARNKKHTRLVLREASQIVDKLRDGIFQGGASLSHQGRFALVAVDVHGALGAVRLGEFGPPGHRVQDLKLDLDVGGVFGGNAGGDERAANSLHAQYRPAGSFK